MPLPDFYHQVQERFPEGVPDFLRFFEKEYLNQESQGAFLRGGVMYGWDWQSYVRDPHFTPEMLTDYLNHFAERQREKREVQRVNPQLTVTTGTTTKRVPRIGGQNLIPESEALEAYREIREAVGLLNHKLSHPEAEIEPPEDYDKVWVQAVLNSVPDSLRKSREGREGLLDIAIFYNLTLPESRPILEDQTRVGFEIEPGAHFNVHPAYLDLAAALVNETLASTDLLEFIIDDLKVKEKLVQIEFRTKPLPRTSLLPKVKVAIDKSIAAFPVLAFNETSTLQGALAGAGWKAHPRLAEIAPGLRPLEFGRLKSKPVQHFTHSLPLASFVYLDPSFKELILPGSGGVKSIVDLVLFFFSKVEAQTSGGTLHVTTKGRNQNAPNLKSSLGTVIGLLEPQTAREVMARLEGRLPSRVDVQGGEKGPIAPLEVFDELPRHQRFNPEHREGTLAAEEKLKAPLFDPLRQDVRVLVEHRGDLLVNAVNAALQGDPSRLAPYLEAFDALDDIKGDETFSRWFA